ncbi:6-bladed beta-propeller [candidate division KSB1 bacterium]
MVQRIMCIIVLCGVICCDSNIQSTGEGIPFVFSESPKYSEGQFVQLEEIHKIQLDGGERYYISDVYMIDADEDKNLYILDEYKSTITVFDKNGEFLKVIAEPGQGPYELERPRSMSIHDGSIFVYQESYNTNSHGIKELGIKERYSKFNVLSARNFRIFRSYKDHFLTVQEVSKDNVDNYHLLCYDKNFTTPDTVTTYCYVSDPMIFENITPEYIVAQNSKDHIYFPADFSEYKVNVFMPDGKLVRSFGREYAPLPYSDRQNAWAKERFSRVRENRRPTIPEDTPVVRFIMVDDRDYIWIVVGECTADCSEDFQVNTTVDIFNEHGEFLYTFSTPYIGPRSVIKNGRLYSSPLEEDYYIRVFKINY